MPRRSAREKVSARESAQKDLDKIIAEIEAEYQRERGEFGSERRIDNLIATYRSCYRHLIALGIPVAIIAAVSCFYGFELESLMLSRSGLLVFGFLRWQIYRAPFHIEKNLKAFKRRLHRNEVKRSHPFVDNSKLTDWPYVWLCDAILAIHLYLALPIH